MGEVIFSESGNKNRLVFYTCIGTVPYTRETMNGKIILGLMLLVALAQATGINNVRF